MATGSDFASERTGWERPAGARPLVLGHRGARFEAPENTLRAFELALAQGADGVELDVRLSADGEVVVFHDLTLQRATSGADGRRIDTLPFAELERCGFLGERIPRLSEVLDWARTTGARLNIELKHDGRNTDALIAKVAQQLAAEPRAPERLLLSCFHPLVVRTLSRSLPEISVAWLVHRKQTLFQLAPGFRLLGARGVNPERTLLRPWLVRHWKRSGALLGTWTINSALEAQRAAALGVDVVISDVPGHVLRALASGTAAE